MNTISVSNRLPGPARAEEVSLSAKRRWKLAANLLKDKKQYRPPTLGQLAGELDALSLEGFDGGMPLEIKSSFNLYEVKKGDSLTKIAKEQLGSAKFDDVIFKTNLDKLESKHRIYAGSVLRIPILSSKQLPESV